MPKYNTRQYQALLQYLQSHPDELLSAQEIADTLSDQSISLTSIYRHLGEMEHDGQVRRCSKGSAREVYYQYMAAKSCQGCLHLSCTSCGRTFHMHTDGADQLLHQVAVREGFAIDTRETVLYGVCQNCQHRAAAEGACP